MWPYGELSPNSRNGDAKRRGSAKYLAISATAPDSSEINLVNRILRSDSVAVEYQFEAIEGFFLLCDLSKQKWITFSIMNKIVDFLIQL